MNLTNRPVMFILILLSGIGVWLFSSGVRSVNVVGLFASGILAGVAIASFFMSRK